MRMIASSVCLFAFALLALVWSVPSQGQALNTAGATGTSSSTPTPKRATSQVRSGAAPKVADKLVSSAHPNALLPVVFVGIVLLVAAGYGFSAAAKAEAAPRSAIYIARGAHATLISGLAVLIIYAAAVAAVVLFR